MVTGGHHREGSPVIFLEDLKDDLELEYGGAGELEVDGAALLMRERHLGQSVSSSSVQTQLWSYSF